MRVSGRHVPRLLTRFGVRDHRHSSSALGIERCRRAETSPGIHTSRYPCSEPSSPADNARKQEDERVAFRRGGAALLLATVRAAEVLLSLRTREAGRGSRANRHFRVERPLRQRIRNMRGKTRKHVRNMFKRGSCKTLVAKAPVARQTTQTRHIDPIRRRVPAWLLALRFTGCGLHWILDCIEFQVISGCFSDRQAPAAH